VTIPETQQDVASCLTALAGSDPIETPISAVFVGPDTVWKLKKAVRLPFLDFTGIDARRRFLQRELDLNQPAAPGLYRDVVPVVRRGDGMLAVAKDGSAVDYVLRMAPVPPEDFLDVMAARGLLTTGLLDRLADSVARYHARLPPLPGRDSAATILDITQGNARAALAAGLPADRVEAWRTGVEATLRTLRPCLTERAAAGFVRRCHGDLHLGNLCLWQGEPVPFDALEFNEEMATIDLAYDLAFLLMDLDHRLDRAAANRVLNRVLARSGDVASVRPLPLFLSERAFIRAHVSASSGQPDAAQGYLAAAEAYLAPPPGMVLAIGGLQGSGKSTLARRLAPGLGAAPGAVILRSDEIRKRQFGAAPEDRLRPVAYQAAANTAVNEALLNLAAEAAGAGHAVILDATFIDPDMRRAAEDVARAAGVPFLGIWLDVPLAELERRVAARRDDASDATLAVLHRSARADLGPMTWMVVDATDGDVPVGAVADKLAAPGQVAAGGLR
jgi:aminoglycoside phosphotransferase family enzyme/predicted kinase